MYTYPYREMIKWCHVCVPPLFRLKFPTRYALLTISRGLENWFHFHVCCHCQCPKSMSSQQESLASVIFWLFTEHSIFLRSLDNWSSNGKISQPTSQSARVISEADNKLPEIIYDFQTIGINYGIVQANEITEFGGRSQGHFPTDRISRERPWGRGWCTSTTHIFAKTSRET